MKTPKLEDESGKVNILQDWEDVSPYVDDVRVASDSNKKSLGFLPASVFVGHARRNQLFVAVDSDSQYLGHLLFDLKFPHATVMQMYANPVHRRRGVAGHLIAALKELLGAYEFLSIRARVAEDLVEANKFWASAGFVVSNRVAGGETTGRKILVRVCELETPQLFPSSGLAKYGADNLGLAAPDPQGLPLYLVDLNVLFDVAHQRAHHEEAVSLFRLAHMGEFQIAISDEAGKELDRTATPGRPDSMRGPIESVPRATLLDSDDTEQLIEKIARLVFPEKVYPLGLKKNDISDVRHIVTAISHGAVGFVTGDDRIVSVAGDLKREYGISVLTAADFLRPMWTDEKKIQLDFGSDSTFEIVRYSDSDTKSVREFLLAQGLKAQEISGKWIPVAVGERLAKRVIAKADDKIVGVCCWSHSGRDDKQVSIRMVADEGQGLVLSIADAMLTSVIQECGAESSSLSLEIPVGQISTKEAAYGYGFRGEASGVLRKLVAKKIVVPNEWQEFRNAIEADERLKLPALMPKWSRYVEPLSIEGADGERRFLSFRELENLLSPVIFALEGRPGLVVPIQRRYSERLLGSNRQLTFGPKLQAELSRQRVYLGDPKTQRSYVKGGLVFFYESGLNAANAIVAVARVVDVFLIRRDESSLESLSKSVLTPETLSEIGNSKNKAACIFDNLLWLQRPVSIGFLRSIGIENGRLITALSLSDTQIRNILESGAINEREHSHFS